MKIIYLTRGFHTIVDDDLYDALNCHKWYAQGWEGRAARRLKDETRRLIYIYHQVLGVNPWELKERGLCVDHINRDITDNRFINLRLVSFQDNMLNSSTSLNKRGVGRDNTHDTWKAYLDLPKKSRINIGTFQTEEEALFAVKQARERWKCA